jgi:hypothetical protein
MTAEERLELWAKAGWGPEIRDAAVRTGRSYEKSAAIGWMLHEIAEGRDPDGSYARAIAAFKRGEHRWRARQAGKAMRARIEAEAGT